MEKKLVGGGKWSYASILEIWQITQTTCLLKTENAELKAAIQVFFQLKNFYFVFSYTIFLFSIFIYIFISLRFLKSLHTNSIISVFLGLLLLTNFSPSYG